MVLQRNKMTGVGIRFIGRRGVGEFQKKIVPPSNMTKGGGRYQGVGAADKAMMA
jgi:hypothetical protein